MSKTIVGLNKKGVKFLKAELERLKPVDYNPDYFEHYKSWVEEILYENCGLFVGVKDKNAWHGTKLVLIDFDSEHLEYQDIDH